MKTQEMLVREAIAESGKTKVKDMVTHVMTRNPGFDKKLVQKNAKELAAEMKGYL